MVQRPDLVLKKRNSKKTSLKFISEESALIQPVETISKTHVAGRLYKNTSHLHLFQSNSYSELPRLNLPFQVKRRMRITCTSSSRNPWPAVSLPHAWGWEKSPEKRRRKTQMAGLATKFNIEADVMRQDRRRKKLCISFTIETDCFLDCYLFLKV